MKTIKKMPVTSKQDVLDELLDEVSESEKQRVYFRMLIAANIDNLLKSRGMTKKALAGALNKNPSEITKWLSGTHNFTMDTLSDIACFFSIELSELLRFHKPEVVHEQIYHVSVIDPQAINVARKIIPHFFESIVIGMDAEKSVLQSSFPKQGTSKPIKISREWERVACSNK